MANGDAPGHGWFAWGKQRGDRSLSEQLIGLDPLFDMVDGRTILDLGSAEGLISAQLVEAGANHADCVEALESRCGVGRQWFGGLPITFHCGDVAGFTKIDALAPEYDVVLLLSIAHKVADPVGFMVAAASRAKETVAVRMPAAVHRDRRSKYVPIDTPAIMDGCEFDKAHSALGPRDEWVGIFTRR